MKNYRDNCISTLLSLTLGGLLLTLPGQAEVQTRESYDFSNYEYTPPSYTNRKPVQLLIEGRAAQQELLPVTATNEGLEIRIESIGGSAIYPWHDLGELKITAPPNKEVSEALLNDNAESKRKVLEPYARTLAPFASIPQDSTNIHQFLVAYLEASLETNAFNEAYALSQDMAIDQIPVELAQPLYRLSKQLLVAEETNKALSLLRQLSAARPAEEFRTSAQDLAKDLMQRRLFTPAYGLHRALLQTVEPDSRYLLSMSCAYLALELDETEAFQKYRSEAIEHQPDDTPTGLTELMDGIAAAKQNDPRMAKNHIAHALALLKADSAWKEIALYYLYLAYAPDDTPQISKSIFKEMDMLYSRGAYTEVIRAQNSSL